MIKEARIGQELAVETENKIGVLADITSIIADHGVSIIAITGTSVGDKAVFQMLTDDNLRAKDALKAKNYDVSERRVVLVELENKPGALKLVSRKLADVNIDLTYLYGSACAAGCPATVIFSSSDNDKAVVTLKK